MTFVVLTELFSYTKSDLLMLTQHIVHFNLLFEKGFLSHEQVQNVDSKIIQVGFKFFCDWLDNIIDRYIMLKRLLNKLNNFSIVHS